MNGYITTSKSAPGLSTVLNQPVDLDHPSLLPHSSETAPPSFYVVDSQQPRGVYIGRSHSQTRPLSSYSISSLASTNSNRKGGRVQLAGSPTLVGAGGMRASASYHSNQHHHHLDSDAQQQQEEILDEERERPSDFDPYAWERPLDTVNRHSRMLEAAPIPATPAESARRLSRMPNAGLLDPFGFSLSAEPSPYDSALNYSTNPSTRQRASFLGLPGTNTSLGTASPYPSTSSMGSIASGSSYPATSTGATSWASNDANVAPGGQPWLKQRSASMGESSGNRAQIRGSLVRPGNRSKLSGEINADTQSLAEVPMSELGVIPKEADYANSKLYQRTLKAQKALEKERAKAAAKGKISKFDLPDKPAVSSLNEKRQSSAGSFMSDMPLPGRRSRSSLGWFRSSSEATLPLHPPPSFTPPLPTSRSVSQLPLPASHLSGPPSPALDPQLLQQQQRLGPPDDRLRAYRASVGGVPSPRATSSGDIRRQRHMSEVPRASLGASAPNGLPLHSSAPQSTVSSPMPSRNNSDNSDRIRQSTLVGPRLQPSPPLAQGNARASPRSNLDIHSNGPIPRTPSPLSAAAPGARPPPQSTDSVHLSSKEPSFDQERTSGGRSEQRAPTPSPPSSESSPNSPVTPQSHSQTGLGLGVPVSTGPSLPPGAAATQTHPIYGSEPVRKRKSSLNLLKGVFGGGKDGGENEPVVHAPAQLSQPQHQEASSSRQGPPPVAAPVQQSALTPRRSTRSSFFSRNKDSTPPTPRAPAPSRPPPSAARPSERAPAPAANMPRLPRSSNTSESTYASSSAASTTLNSSTGSSRLGKSKPSSGGSFFSFGRSRSKTVDARSSPTLQPPPANTKHSNSSWTDLTNTFTGGRGSKEKSQPSEPQVLSRGQPQQRQQAAPTPPVKPKKASRWGSGAGDGYHPAPPPSYA